MPRIAVVVADPMNTPAKRVDVASRWGWTMSRRVITRIMTLIVVVLASLLWSGIQIVAQTVIATVPVGVGAVGIAANPTTNRVYVTNGTDGTLSVIDGATNTVVATFSVDTEPVGVAVNPATNRIYVTHFLSNTVSVIDGATNTVVASVLVGSGPNALAVNPTTNRIYVINNTSKTTSVIDGSTNQVIATVPIGNNATDVAINPSTNLIYVVNQSDSTFIVIDGATNEVTAIIPTFHYPNGVAVNPITNRIYLASASIDDVTPVVTVIDGSTNEVTAIIPTFMDPTGIAMNPSTNHIYVTHRSKDIVSVVDGAINAVVANIAVGGLPVRVAVNPTTSRIYVVNIRDNTVSVIEDLVPTPTVTSTATTAPTATETHTPTSTPTRTPTSTSTPTVTSTAVTPIPLPTNIVDVKKTASPSSSLPGGIIDYTVVVTLGSPKSNVVVEDLFLYGVDFVPGSALLNVTPIEPVKTVQQPNRVVYEFRLGSLPVGITTLNFQGRVDPSKPCQGQKVRNGVHLIVDGITVDQSDQDTLLSCATHEPTATRTLTATGTPSGEPTMTPTPTMTPSPSSTLTVTPTPTVTVTPAPFQPKPVNYWIANQSAIKPLLPITVYDDVVVGDMWQAARYLKDYSGYASRDASRSLFAQLLAAKLNVTAGAGHSCIDAVIVQTEDFLVAHPYGSNPTGVDRDEAVALQEELDAYNNYGCS
jgi:YVTN family beta-propeller protein